MNSARAFLIMDTETVTDLDVLNKQGKEPIKIPQSVDECKVEIL